MTADRTPCLVPHCRRTTRETYAEWICGKHWRAVPDYLRRRKTRLFRRYRRQFGDVPFWQFPAGAEKRLAAALVGANCPHLVRERDAA